MPDDKKLKISPSRKEEIMRRISEEIDKFNESDDLNSCDVSVSITYDEFGWGSGFTNIILEMSASADEKVVI